jgi:hypothetical protein
MYVNITKSTNLDQEKSSKYDFLFSRISDVDEHLKDVADQTGKKFNIIKDNVINDYIDK